MTQVIPKQVWRHSHDESGRFGEGITRCSDPSAGFYWITVYMRGAPPMASCVRANSAEQAEAFCMARHPNAVLARCMEGQ
jgi:hypothetical protein